MVTRTFLSKCTTIFENSKDNFGLNPIGILTYGKSISRALIYFDKEKIMEYVNHGYDMNKFKHILKLTNCGFFNNSDTFKNYERATSFDLIVFKVPCPWDEGVGFNQSEDKYIIGSSSISKEACNWFQPMNSFKWSDLNQYTNGNFSDGIYTTDYLYDEYVKFLETGNTSIIICEQHFDHGNENMSFDITSYINEMIQNEQNYGLCIAFSPVYEEMKSDVNKYVGFFTNKTNTFYQPYLESRYEGAIEDDRYTYYSGKKNRLYFFANFENELIKLDENPSCTIECNGVEYVYTSSTEYDGCYYIESDDMSVSSPTVCYDVWSNITYSGMTISDVENGFVAHPHSSYFKNKNISSKSLNPILYGINNDENIYQGDKRNITAEFKIPYSNNYELLSSCYYRIYIKDESKEIDVIDWDKMNKIENKNEFLINTEDFIPQTYYIDLKYEFGNERRIFKDVVHFKIIDNISEIKK